MRSLINDLFAVRGLVKDGTSGRSLVERPVELLEQAISRVKEKGHQPNFANNSALLQARRFMLQLREELPPAFLALIGLKPH